MPDINIFKDPKPVADIPVIPAQSPQGEVAGLANLGVKAPMWLSTASAQTPYRTKLSDTQKFVDPNIGYNPFDSELEYKYADAHPYKTFGNNILKGFAKLGGTFLQSISTIPRAIEGVGNTSNLYDTGFTNTLQDWYEDLEISLPTFKNQEQTEHPITSWFTGNFTNNLGGAVNNLGFTAGAILGAVAETAAITYLTRGLGTPAAVGRGLTRFFGNFGRSVASGRTAAVEVGNLAREANLAANEAKLLERGAHQMGGTWKQLPNSTTELSALNTERGIIKAEQGLVRTADDAVNPNWTRHTGTGVPNEFAAGTDAVRSGTVNKIDKGLNNIFAVTKITDAVRYNLGLLTSALAEGSFEANQVMRNTEAEAKQAFYDINGYDAKAEDMKQIDELSRTAADFTMKANIAILYLSNRLNWGSLFKPTTQTVVSGSVRNGFGRFGKVLDKETGLYKLVNKSPNSRLGQSLLYLTSPVKTVQRGLVESAEEGAQFITSEGSQDYARRKYDGTNRGELADYIKSFSYGLDRTFNSNEGLENLVGGFVGGILGGFMFKGANLLRGVKNMTAKQRLQYQIDGLNQATFKNVFQHHVDGAAAQQSMAKDYEKAVKSGDLFTAKNIKAEMLHNWVNTAMKTNSFDARLDEIEAAKGLTGAAFSDMWGGLEYNEDNRQDAVNYLEGVKQKALRVKKDIDKVDRLFLGNPFNKKTQANDWAAHETWKESLAKHLGVSRDYQERIKQLEVDINTVLPGMNVNEAIQLTSKAGIRDILTKMDKAMTNLAKLEVEAESSPELRSDYAAKRNALSKLFTEMQDHIFSNFEAKDFIPTLRKMYKLMQGGSMEANTYLDYQKRIGEPGVVYIQPQAEEVNDDEIIDVFERLIDTNKLHEANYQAVYAYNSLLKPRGAQKYSEYVKSLIDQTNAAITVTDDGVVETPVDIERQAEADAELATTHMPEEEMTKEKRDEVRDIIIKQAAGEELTPEEEAVLEAHPLFEEKVKTAQVIKAAVLKEKSPKQQAKEANQAQQAKAEQKNYNEDESGFRKEISPVELLNKINSHEKVGKDANKNLFKAIFSKVNNFLNNNLTARLAQSDFKAEQEKNGNVKQSYTQIPLFDTRGNKAGMSGIYKSRYERNVEVYHNGEFIGVLKPADSLFLDATGTRTIYEMTEAEFTDVTGMPRTEYKAYMKELNAYKKAYDSLVGEFTGAEATTKAVKLPHELSGAKPRYNYIDKEYELNFESDIDKAAYITAQTNKSKRDADYLKFVIDNTGLTEAEVRDYGSQIRAFIKPLAKEGDGGILDIPAQKTFGNAAIAPKSIVDNATLLKYFPEIRVNLGNTVFNSSTAKDSDTLIKDLAHKPTGTALISYKNEGGYRKATIVNERELAANNPSYYNKLKAFISTDKFKAQAQSNNGRYMLAVPINGEYTNNSLIYSRPAEINQEYKDKLVDTLKNNVGKELDPEFVHELNYVINSTYYIANADRSVKGTTIDILVNEDGSLSLQIQNNEKGTVYNNTLNVENPQITDYDSVIKLIQDRIKDEEHLDRNLQKLKITVKDDSIKFQVLNDKDVYSLKDVEAQIKVATTPNVFENFSVNVYPKGSNKGEPRQGSKAATQKQRETTLEKVANLKPVAGKITDLDVMMAKADPLAFIKYIADQAFGMTRDADDNRIPHPNGGQEQSLVDRFGKEIIDGAKAMFPLETTAEEVMQPKTDEEIQRDREAAALRTRNAKIDQEYFNKKLALHDSFINNLTPTARKIKDFITNNPIFVGQEVLDVHADIAQKAGVTNKDVTDYIYMVSVYNQQHAKLTNIAESKKQSDTLDTTGETIFANTVAETSIILQDLFGLPKDQADATATVYERNRQAWVERTYNEELAYRKAQGKASSAYQIAKTEKTLNAIQGRIDDLKDQMEITKDNGRQMILQQKIDAEEQKLGDGTQTLYGVDLLNYIKQQSYTRFGFGKMAPTQLTDQLINQKIIEINCN